MSEKWTAETVRQHNERVANQAGRGLPHTKQLERPAQLGDESKAILSAKRKTWLAEHGHPKGTKGKPVSQETRAKISEANTGREVPPERVERSLRTGLLRHGTLAPNNVHGSWRSGWRVIGGKRIYARSRWEANYARYLQWLKENQQILEWEHEPDTFWFDKIKRGCRTYLPDFKVTNNNRSLEYHETKGWMDARSKTKIRRMAKYHPSIILKVFDGKWFRSNQVRLRGLIKDWEHD